MELVVFESSGFEIQFEGVKKKRVTREERV